VGLRAGLDAEARVKILCPCRGSNPDRPVVQPVVRHYTDLTTPAPFLFVRLDFYGNMNTDDDNRRCLFLCGFRGASAFEAIRAFILLRENISRLCRT
jgi:hypothetical protein